jgi:predicted ATP-dependent endonuclease of OLD family
VRIKSVKIDNFRSIKSVEIPFNKIDDKECSIFLGKNESGKSNILKALSLLDRDNKVDYLVDCNKDSKKENKKISIVFDLSVAELLWNAHIEKELSLSKNTIEVELLEKHIEINSKNERFEYFHVYIKDTDNIKNYIFNAAHEIIEIKKLYEGVEKLTEDNIITLIPTYSILTKEALEIIIESRIKPVFEINTPKVIYWKPSSKYLINEMINLNTFKDNTSNSIPLKNIFHIANMDDKQIKSRIELVVNDDEEREELCQTLSEEITGYVNSIWSEHKISINVRIEKNMECTVNIEDNDYSRPKYKMGQRSDGFKQFISILLNLSAENKTSILKDKLILLDEPEVHLHPSGIRYLRDELLKISENNNLIIATHSTYMIDKLNLNRHFSITKNKSLTEVKQIEENNPYEEEVLYESLGTSIFEFISPTMLIFEGKTDTDLFNVFSYKFRNELNIKNISAISANGVDKIPTYVKFFSGELVKGFVVVDSDNIGKSTKKIIIKDNDKFNNNNTFELSDLLSDVTKNMTLEDMIPKKIIEDVLLDGFLITLDLTDNEPFITQIKNKHKTINEKELKMGIAESVIIDINKQVMTKEKTKEKYFTYYEFISNLYNKLHY